MILQQPFGTSETEGKYDVMCTVRGGVTAAGAIRHGIARALATADTDLRTFEKAGMLTRDARAVERKKYGQPGARKRFQFSGVKFIFAEKYKSRLHRRLFCVAVLSP